MIVSDVVTRVKRQFGDESGVQVIDADVIRWINDAQKDIAQTQEILEAAAEVGSHAGQDKYTLPNDIINLRAVYYNGLKLKALSLQEYDLYITNWQGQPTVSGVDEYSDTYSDLYGAVSHQDISGIPEVFYVWALQMNLFPVPDTDDQEIKLYYSKFPANVVLVTDALSLPIKYDNRIVEYCLQQAYELDEQYDAANMKGTQFAGSLQQMREDSSWTEHTSYPNITVMPEDL